MSVALIAIGIPGSGKTTLLRPLADEYGLTYISKDDIRAELLGSAEDQSRNRDVWEEANRRAVDALANGQGVLLDGTYVERWKRHDAIALLRDAGADSIIGVIADVPIPVAKERNRLRDRVVDETVIDWMHAKLLEEPPALEEGFDALLTFEQLELLRERFKN